MSFLQIVARGVFLLVFVPLAAAAQPHPSVSADTLRLEAIFTAIQEANPALRALRLEAEALATERRQVQALPDPMVGVTVQPVPIHTARGTQRSQWRVEQTIPYPGKRALQAEIADRHAEVAALNADASAQDLLLRATQAYLAVQRTQTHAMHIAAFQARLRDFEEAATTRYEVGTGTQQSILKAQLERNRLSLRLEQLEADRRSALEALARLVGQPLHARYVQPLTLETSAVPDSALALAVAARPEVDALDVAALRATQQEALARRMFYPDVTVSLNYFDIAESDMPPTSDGRDALAVGAGLRIPLWRDRLRAGVEEAQVRQRIVAAQREALIQSLAAELNALAERLARLQEQLQLVQETLLPQADATLEATLSAYSTGQVRFLDLLDAERTRFNLRMEETDLRIQLLQTAAEWDRTLGTSWLLPVERE